MPENKNITIYSLAKELGMTPSMVSRAFNPGANVDAEKRRRVLEKAEEYGFRPNRFASRLSGRPLHIGVLIRCAYRPVAASLIRGIEQAYRSLQDLKVTHTVILISDWKSPEECRGELRELDGCDGVILSGFSGDAFAPMLLEFQRKNPNLVFLQNVNDAVPYLFASKHDERNASELAAEFLFRCLRGQNGKNVLLFTGQQQISLHQNARKAFRDACGRFALSLPPDDFDMSDDENELKRILPDVFRRYPAETVGGIYITSGNSVSLCAYLYENGYRGDLVTFDLYEEHRKYLENGLISATIYQNPEMQGEQAFSLLVRYLVSGVRPPETVYTDVRLILKSNMSTVPVCDE